MFSAASSLPMSQSVPFATLMSGLIGGPFQPSSSDRGGHRTPQHIRRERAQRDAKGTPTQDLAELRAAG
eukprot:CAMPEP_0172197184 /NCGR_PEP_ID=MMETSP1050-20130122/27295_1 /TAXON_ID=233186 /ORGANISM="Cryptomonas curvata, Strain CCAP979/52" /LENGTH=68 /DNA_ID=CAMNT_0012873675 /DNA_START=211 /DNA_END=413 /DNA_ORIENTATION=+